MTRDDHRELLQEAYAEADRYDLLAEYIDLRYRMEQGDLTEFLVSWLRDLPDARRSQVAPALNDALTVIEAALKIEIPY